MSEGVQITIPGANSLHLIIAPSLLNQTGQTSMTNLTALLHQRHSGALHSTDLARELSALLWILQPHQQHFLETMIVLSFRPTAEVIQRPQWNRLVQALRVQPTGLPRLPILLDHL
jgi:hypothetical protein